MKLTPLLVGSFGVCMASLQGCASVSTGAGKGSSAISAIDGAAPATPIQPDPATSGVSSMGGGMSDDSGASATVPTASADSAVAPADASSPEASSSLIAASGDGSAPPDQKADASVLNYWAKAEVGGFDRIFISAADAARGVCVQVILITSGKPSVLPISVPAPFSVNSVRLLDGAKCSDLSTWWNGLAATSGGGTITWQPPAGVSIPCTIDIHAHVTFPATQALPSLTFALDVDRLKLQNFCP